MAADPARPADRALALAALAAAGTVGIWGPWSLGLMALPSAFGAFPWLVHEGLFGVLPLVVAGLLWRDRPPRPAMAWLLVVVWLAGRLAVGGGGAGIGPMGPALVAMALPAVVAGMAGRDRRRLPMVGGLVLLLGAQAVFHWEVWRFGWPEIGLWAGLAVALAGLLALTRGRPGVTVAVVGAGLAGYGLLTGAFGATRAAVLVLLLGGIATAVFGAASPPGGRLAPAVSIVAVAALAATALERSWTMLLTPVAWAAWVLAFGVTAVLLWRRS